MQHDVIAYTGTQRALTLRSFLGLDRSSGAQLQLPVPSSYQVAVAHWRVMMSFVRVLSNSTRLQKRLDTPAFVLTGILLRVVEGFVSSLSFFSCRHRVRLGHRDLASFLRAVAEACSPQRFREENAVVRFISLS